MRHAASELTRAEGRRPPQDQDSVPCVLTVAGSDSGGNAGVQADLRAFHAYGVHGCTVFAALTAQNSFGVSGAMAVPPDFVGAQLDAVLGTYSIRAVKTGMLPDAETIGTVCGRLARFPEIPKVVDPVMIATSGARLVSGEAVAAITELLFPLATLITPNIPEAEFLAGEETADRSGGGSPACRAQRLAEILHGKFGCAVLVKGGHGVGDDATDVLCEADGSIRRFSLPRIQNPVSTHGTGCTMAAAIAAGLALGNDAAQAVESAKRHVYEAVRRSSPAGVSGCGVLGFAPAG